MTRHVLTFLATFALGAAIALALRTARHDPHAAHAEPPSAGAPSAPHPAGEVHAAPSPAVPVTAATAAAKSDAAPVNTVCAICGMKVDPNLPTAEYQGKTIGFGCRMCPPKFKADPDRYGPSYLRNEVMAK